MHHPHPLPTSRRFPDPRHFADLERLGQEITELAAEQKDEPADVSAETPVGVDLCEAQPYPVVVCRADALEITHKTLACRWTGEQMDYSLAVWGLQSRE